MFSQSEAARLRASGAEHDFEVGDLMERNLASGDQTAGVAYQVFLLSSPENNETLKLKEEIKHTERGAWTQGQRYTSSEALRRGPATTQDLTAEGG